MLETLDQLGAVGEAAAQIATEYEQPLEAIQRDLCALCADLHQRGLIELDDRPA
jgi:cob(I)alamin adenosyltransferase